VARAVRHRARKIATLTEIRASFRNDSFHALDVAAAGLRPVAMTNIIARWRHSHLPSTAYGPRHSQVMDHA